MLEARCSRSGLLTAVLPCVLAERARATDAHRNRPLAFASKQRGDVTCVLDVRSDPTTRRYFPAPLARKTLL